MDIQQMIEAIGPDELQAIEQRLREEEEAKEQARIEKLAVFAESLTRSRERAKSYRKGLGIEDEWDDADDAYEGVDDANRHLHARRAAKPGGSLVSERKPADTRSVVLLNITRPYVDAAAARVGDMLLPVDDSCWAIKPTPRPSLTSSIQMTPVAAAVGQMGQMPPAGPMPPGMGGTPGVPPMGMPGMAPQGMPPDAEQQLQQIDDAANKAAALATKKIEDWLVQCQWHAEMRKVIDNAARLGTGVLKGPTPYWAQSRSVVQQGGMVALEVDRQLLPQSRSIDPRNVFPDPGCGDDLRNGSFIWERDQISAKQLRDMKGLPGYLDGQIEKALELGPGGAKGGARGCNDEDMFEVWYYHGLANDEDLESAGVEVDDENGALSCVVTLVEDLVIQAGLNPLESGELPYDFLPWQKREGMPWGIGVATQIRTPQRMLTASIRNLMDNAGVSAGPQIVVNRRAIRPTDKRWSLTPMKIWEFVEGAEVSDMKNAFATFAIDSRQAELMGIVQFALKMAEDTTGLPQLLQGQIGQAPDTVGGMRMLNNNAGAVLRRIARTSDDMVTERHIVRYYEWLMLYDDDESAKGDFQIDARGSSALVEIDMQNQAIQQMGQMVMNPAFEIDPAKWFVEMLKSQKLDPKRFVMDEQKKAAMAQQQPPPPPQIAVAQINAQSREKVAELQAQATVQKMAIDTDRDAVYTEAQASRDQANNEAKIAELQLRERLALLDYANKNELKLEEVKAKLAETAMKLQSTERLARMQVGADKLPKPPIEPPGRATPGRSYQE